MNHKEFQLFIEEKIPLLKKAGFRISTYSDELVSVEGSLSENRNHHNTAFGGSISMILILAAWAMIYKTMENTNASTDIVIASQTVDYIRPVKTDFTALCHKPDDDVIDCFMERFDEIGSGKINISATLHQKDSSIIYAQFKSVFFVKRQ